jgi:hypothetical protein
MKNEEIERHHIWCNYWGTPVEICKQCKGLKEKYPEDGLTLDELLKNTSLMLKLEIRKEIYGRTKKVR